MSPSPSPKPFLSFLVTQLHFYNQYLFKETMHIILRKKGYITPYGILSQETPFIKLHKAVIIVFYDNTFKKYLCTSVSKKKFTTQYARNKTANLLLLHVLYQNMFFFLCFCSTILKCDLFCPQ